MRSWYEFGYHGFPTGERRLRFFCQRDDPCGSDEDCDFDNETNDRPVFYYPMRESEEGSSTTATPVVTDEEERDVVGWGSSSKLPFLVHTTAVEEVPSWYGASVYRLVSASGVQLVVRHGGVAVATCEVDHRCHLATLRPSTAHPGAVQYASVNWDDCLADLLNWPLAHPALMSCEPVMCNATPQPRYAACAAPIPIPSELSRQLMTEGLPYASDALGRPLAQYMRPLLREAAQEDSLEMHLALVLGGATTTPTPAGITVGCTRSTTVISRPELSLTLVQARADGSSAHWSRSFPITGAAMNALTPRTHATLTPWPAAPEESGRQYTMVYLGGSGNGMEPLPLFAVNLLTISFTTWEWSAQVREAMGPEPCARFGHSTTTVGDSLYVVGGVSRGGQYLSDLQLLNCRTLIWREVFLPMSLGMPPRAFHGAAVVEHGRCTVLVIVGGEADGAFVDSVWACSVSSQACQEASFPLLGQPHSYHVMPVDAATSPIAKVSTAFTQERLLETVRSIAQRHATPSDSEGRGPEVVFFSTCHGSMLNVLSIVGSNGASGLLALGGSRSPPVLLATHVQAPEHNLKDTVARWLFAGPGVVTQRIHAAAPHFFNRLLSGTYYSHCLSTTHEQLPKFHVQEGREEPYPFRTDTHTAFIAETHRLACRSQLEEQWGRWLRGARKRLRDGYTHGSG